MNPHPILKLFSCVKTGKMCFGEMNKKQINKYNYTQYDDFELSICIFAI